MSFLTDLQTALNHFVTNAGDFVKADCGALITSIDAQVAAGKLDAATAAQEKQFPTNVIALVDMLEQATGGPIPAGAGPIYILSLLGKASSGAQQQALATQLKLVLGSGQALLHMPGLPF